MPSCCCKKLLQAECCCSHRHGILTELAETDARNGEWLPESIALNELAKLWENVLADLQTGPSSQKDELWVEKVNEIGDTSPEIVGGVFEQPGCNGFPLPGGINNSSENAVLIVALEKLTLWLHFSQSFDHARRSSVGFQAAVTATAAQTPIKFQTGVSPFSSTIARTPVEGTMSDDPGTDTRSYKHDRYMLNPLACAKQTLGLCHGFSRVIKIDGHAEAFLEQSA